MPTNTGMERCISSERGALVFWSPELPQRKPGARVQIIDVFSLQVVTGYTRDPQGRLLLEASPSLAAGRNWTVAKASQLIRNDTRPHRWVALQLDRQAWGLFWAGGGLQHCRDMLFTQSGGTDAKAALVPATPEALLRLVLDLNLMEGASVVMDTQRSASPSRPVGGGRLGKAPSHQPLLHELLNDRLDARKRRRLIWRIAVGTSLVWLVVLGVTAAGFQSILEQQDRKLELLLERTAPLQQQGFVTPAR